MRRIREGDLDLLGSVIDDDLADEIYAACRLIARGDGPSANMFRSATALHDAVEQLAWPDDHLGEKTQLLAALAYLAWLHARRSGSDADATYWEERTTSQALRQDAVRAFLAIPARARSEELNCRFLRDAAVLVASCVQLRRLQETSPLVVLKEAEASREWLLGNSAVFESREEVAYFAAEFALVLAGAAKQCGRYVDCQNWLKEAERNSAEVAGPERLLARTRYLRLAVLHHLYSYDEVLQQIPALKEAFEQLGMGASFAKCSYLEAITLKQVGRDAEARAALDSLRCDPDVVRDQSLYALVLMASAELEGRAGHFEAATADLLRARDLLQRSGSSMSIGHLNAIRGELLRDQGRLLEASEAYRASAAVYSVAGMAAMAAYIRIVLAETLLAAGADDQAIQEIVGALVTINEIGLIREATAAIALLGESLRRHKVDHSALRELREQLDRMRKDGEL